MWKSRTDLRKKLNSYTKEFTREPGGRGSWVKQPVSAAVLYPGSSGVLRLISLLQSALEGVQQLTLHHSLPPMARDVHTMVGDAILRVYVFHRKSSVHACIAIIQMGAWRLSRCCRKAKVCA